MKYKILEGSSGLSLSNKVQEHLDEGWTLYGYPIVSSAGAGSSHSTNFREIHIQAVIKTEEGLK